MKVPKANAFKHWDVRHIVYKSKKTDLTIYTSAVQYNMKFVLFFLLLYMIAVNGYNYDWDRLHRCMTPSDLFKTVADYQENFPCLDCRDHFNDLLSQHPFPLEYVKTAEDVRVWTWFTHNLVNERLNKTWESFDIMLECHEKL